MFKVFLYGMFKGFHGRWCCAGVVYGDNDKVGWCCSSGINGWVGCDRFGVVCGVVVFGVGS